MAFWRNIYGFMTGAGNRQAGLQTGQPATYNTRSASPVTIDSALQLSAVWSCVRLIAECIGSLPINIYKKNSDGSRVLDTLHPLSILFNGKVNQWQTRQEYMESVAYQLVLLGNDYSKIDRNKQGQIISLTPFMSAQMNVDLLDSGSVVYNYSNGKDINVYSDKTVWHNKLFGNGIVGLSPLAYARNSIGVGSAAENSVSKIYQNGGKPSGILTIDKVIPTDQRAQIKSNFAEMSDGNESRLFVLEAGMQYQQVSLSPQDIELLASRRFQIEDIARFFGVPSVLINDTQGTTAWGSGIQQIVQGWYKLGLRPYLERYESSMKARLFTPEERVLYDIEFDFNALLRPDLADRIKSAKEAVTGALMTPNEFRLSEGWTAKDGGDELFLQQQNTPIDQLRNIPRGSATDAQKT